MSSGSEGVETPGKTLGADRKACGASRSRTKRRPSFITASGYAKDGLPGLQAK